METLNLRSRLDKAYDLRSKAHGPRPRVYDPTMADIVRFPLPRDLHTRLRALATADGQTLTGWLRAVCDALETDAAPAAPAPQAAPQAPAAAPPELPRTPRQMGFAPGAKVMTESGVRWVNADASGYLDPAG